MTFVNYNDAMMADRYNYVHYNTIRDFPQFNKASNNSGSFKKHLNIFRKKNRTNSGITKCSSEKWWGVKFGTLSSAPPATHYNIDHSGVSSYPFASVRSVRSRPRVVVYPWDTYVNIQEPIHEDVLEEMVVPTKDASRLAPCKCGISILRSSSSGRPRSSCRCWSPRASQSTFKAPLVPLRRKSILPEKVNLYAVSEENADTYQNGLNSCHERISGSNQDANQSLKSSLKSSSEANNSRFVKSLEKRKGFSNSSASRKSILECDVTAYDLIKEYMNSSSVQNVNSDSADDSRDDALEAKPRKKHNIRRSGRDTRTTKSECRPDNRVLSFISSQQEQHHGFPTYAEDKNSDLRLKGFKSLSVSSGEFSPPSSPQLSSKSSSSVTDSNYNSWSDRCTPESNSPSIPDPDYDDDVEEVSILKHRFENTKISYSPPLSQKFRQQPELGRKEPEKNKPLFPSLSLPNLTIKQFSSSTSDVEINSSTLNKYKNLKERSTSERNISFERHCSLIDDIVDINGQRMSYLPKEIENQCDSTFKKTEEKQLSCRFPQPVKKQHPTSVSQPLENQSSGFGLQSLENQDPSSFVHPNGYQCSANFEEQYHTSLQHVDKDTYLVSQLENNQQCSSSFPKCLESQPTTTFSQNVEDWEPEFNKESLRYGNSDVVDTTSTGSGKLDNESDDADTSIEYSDTSSMSHVSSKEVKSILKRNGSSLTSERYSRILQLPRYEESRKKKQVKFKADSNDAVILEHITPTLIWNHDKLEQQAEEELDDDKDVAENRSNSFNKTMISGDFTSGFRTVSELLSSSSFEPSSRQRMKDSFNSSSGKKIKKSFDLFSSGRKMKCSVEPSSGQRVKGSFESSCSGQKTKDFFELSSSGEEMEDSSDSSSSGQRNKYSFEPSSGQRTEDFLEPSYSGQHSEQVSTGIHDKVSFSINISCKGKNKTLTRVESGITTVKDSLISSSRKVLCNVSTEDTGSYREANIADNMEVDVCATSKDTSAGQGITSFKKNGLPSPTECDIIERTTSEWGKVKCNYGASRTEYSTGIEKCSPDGATLQHTRGLGVTESGESLENTCVPEDPFDEKIENREGGNPEILRTRSGDLVEVKNTCFFPDARRNGFSESVLKEISQCCDDKDVSNHEKKYPSITSITIKPSPLNRQFEPLNIIRNAALLSSDSLSSTPEETELPEFTVERPSKSCDDEEVSTFSKSVFYVSVNSNYNSVNRNGSISSRDDFTSRASIPDEKCQKYRGSSDKLDISARENLPDPIVQTSPSVNSVMVDATSNETSETRGDDRGRSVKYPDSSIYMSDSKVIQKEKLCKDTNNCYVPLEGLHSYGPMKKSFFKGASKADILHYLENAKERGFEQMMEEDIEILIEEEEEDKDDEGISQAKTKARNHKMRISNVSSSSESSGTSEENTMSKLFISIPMNQVDSKHLRITSPGVERNDVGEETSKSSLTMKRHCTDCNQQVEPRDGMSYVPLVCKKCERKRYERKELIREIVVTEIKYGRDLNIVKEEFYRPMEVAGLLGKEQLRQIFLNIDELISFSVKFAEKLKDAIHIAREQGDEDYTTVNIGKLFLESTAMFHAFETYCVQQGPSSLLLHNLEKEKELLRVFLRVSQMENIVLRRMNLSSFLMVPVQRVTKYPLLLTRLYKVTPIHHPDKETIKEAKQKVELHLEHINQQTKGVSETKIWRRISNISTSTRRLSNGEEIGHIKLRKMALEVLNWNRDEVRFVMAGKLQFYPIADMPWNKKGKPHKFVTVHALLVTLGKPNSNYKPDLANENSILFPRNTGIRNATLLLMKERNGRFVLVKDPMHLGNCVISSDPENYETFEVQEYTTKEAYFFKADTMKESSEWLKQLRYHAKDLGTWRKRRNALANIMINGMVRQ